MVKKIGALVGKYNLLAAERGMQKIPYPSYGSVVNDISKSLLLRDLKTIGKVVKKIEEVPVVDKMKTAKGVEFTAMSVSGLPGDVNAWKDGLWYYIKDGENICVYADTGEIIARMNGGTELTLDYNDMPYEVLVDTDGNEWKVNSYAVEVKSEEDGNPAEYSGLFGVREEQEGYENVNTKLTSLTLQNWTNRNVTNMAYMFYYCVAIETLNLRNFNTSAVTNMAYMFDGCILLKGLDLSGFNTSAVTNMAYMFSVCSALTELDLSKFDTGKVENMVEMFYGCSALTELDLSKFDTKAVTSMGNMFGECYGLTELDLSNFNTNLVDDMRSMFRDCKSLNSLDLSRFNTEKVENMSYMFNDCGELTYLTLGENFTIISGEDNSTFLAPENPCEITMNNASYTVLKERELANYTFDPDSWTSSTDLQTFTVTPPTVARGVVFTEGVISELPDLAAWKDGNDSLWYYIKDGDDICVYADTVKIKARMDGTELTLKTEDMPYTMLIDNEGNECKVNRYTVGVSINSNSLYCGLFGRRGDFDADWNSNVIEILTGVSLWGWSNKNVTDMSYMFSGCSAFTGIYLDIFNTEAVTNMSGIFSGCPALTGLTLTDGFVVPSNYGNEETIMNLAPENVCTIIIDNETTYNAFRNNDLADYTWSPDSWTGPSYMIQQFTVTPPPTSS